MDLKCKLICNKTTVCILLLPTLQCLLGVLILILIERLNTIAREKFHTTMCAFGDSTIIYQMYGVRMKIIYVACISLMLKSYNDVYTSHLSFALKFWVIFAVETSAEAIVIAVQYFLNREAMEVMLGSYLVAKMRTYMLESESRQIWDALQLNGQCCGLYSFDDWVEISGNVVSNYTFIPYSCCRRNENCYSTIKLDNYINEIYQSGCLQNIFNLIRSLKHSVIILMGVTIVLQVIILIVLRILFLHQRQFDSNGNDEK